MSRIVGVTFALLLVPTLSAESDVQRGKFKKFDPEKKQVTLTVGDKDVTFMVNEKTRVFGAENKKFNERFDGLKVGTQVMFTTDESETLLALKPVRAGRPVLIEKVDTSKLKPLDELGADKYQGYQGGFYPKGKNERPAAHEKAGLKLAKAIKPLDRDGKPDDDGKIVLLSVGMTFTLQSSHSFEEQLRGDKDVNPRVRFINGAQSGMWADKIRNPDDGHGKDYWEEIDRRLKYVKLSREQVQVVWIEQAHGGPIQGFPKHAQKLESDLAEIVRILPKRFPNVKLVYLSSRTYGGYAKTTLNPEPYAYESGFSVKWLIEKQIEGDKTLNYDPDKGVVKAPWLIWGPYLWANGSTKRKDGFSYEESDFHERERTHQSESGSKKVGKLMLDFFKSDTTTKPWFLR
jgi:Cu/Ag efflux protein CusF